MRTLLRRAAATGVPIASLVKVLVTFATAVRLENLHPLQSGLLRTKRRSERRPGLPRENVFLFWARYAGETAAKHAAFAAAIVKLMVTAIAIARGRDAKVYMDQALTPVGGDGDETLDLFTKTAGGKAHVAHVRRVEAAVALGRPAA
jgi:hypothetical protein